MDPDSDAPLQGALTCDLATLVREQVEAQRQTTPGRLINLTLHPESAAPVNADADDIRQVLAVYLSNALTASPPHRPVAVSLEVREGQAHVAVHDQGPYIPPDEMRQLIGPDPLPSPENAALAEPGSARKNLRPELFQCRHIIQRYGGHLGLNSGPASGSTSWFELPLAPV